LNEQVRILAPIRGFHPENVMYRFAFNFMNEINPMGLIPGYSDLIETLKNGELQDDAMSVVGKIMSAVKTSINAVSGQSKSGWYRDVEDSVGQLAQLFTNVPAKNMMRDARAIAATVLISHLFLATI
jgi:hypothetical protein